MGSGISIRISSIVCQHTTSATFKCNELLGRILACDIKYVIIASGAFWVEIKGRIKLNGFLRDFMNSQAWMGQESMCLCVSVSVSVKRYGRLSVCIKSNAQYTFDSPPLA